MNAKDLLLYLQKPTVLRYNLMSAQSQNLDEDIYNETFEKIYDDYKQHSSQEEVDEIREEFEDFEQTRKEVELPTPFQDKESYMLLQGFWKIIEDILPTTKFKHKETEEIKTLKRRV